MATPVRPFLHPNDDWFGVVESLYQSWSDPEIWAARLREQLLPLIAAPMLGVQAVRLSERGTISDVLAFAAPPTVMNFRERLLSLDTATVRSHYCPPQMLVIQRNTLPRASLPDRAMLRAFLDGTGIRDAFAVVVRPTPDIVLLAYAAVNERVTLSRTEREVLSRLGLHMEASYRLATRPESLVAVVDPNGRVEHLREGWAPAPIGGAARGVQRASRQRGALGASALGLWEGLVAGELTVVERRIGTRRHVFFLENPPHRYPLSSLSPGEIDALTMICQGRSAKEVGYALGVSESAISLRLARATAKIGAASRTELIRLAALLVGDPRGRFPDPVLTAAEAEVLELVTRGLTNRQISAQRGRSIRTVANQVASLLNKSGAQSRRALVARASRPRKQA